MRKSIEATLSMAGSTAVPEMVLSIVPKYPEFLPYRTGTS